MNGRCRVGWFISNIKKVSKIPRAAGRRSRPREPQARRSGRSHGCRGSGYTYLHVAVDYSRISYVEVCDDETAATLAGFWS